MKLLKLSVIASAVLLSTGCASTGNMFSKVTNSVTSVVAPSEDEYVVEEPQLIGYEVVEMKNAKNSYSYPYGYYQAKPKYTTPNLGLSPGTEPGEWYRPNQQFYESQVPVGYVENTKHDILGFKAEVENSIKIYSNR
mgnify:CR=1 FL=1